MSLRLCGLQAERGEALQARRKNCCSGGESPPSAKRWGRVGESAAPEQGTFVATRATRC